MTFNHTDRFIVSLPPPDLYGTLSNGQVVSLWNPVIRYHAANQPILLLGRYDVAAVSQSYPDVYTLIFYTPQHYDQNAAVQAEGEKLTINQIVFRIDSVESVDDCLRYTATGYPAQIAATIPQNDTSCFPNWEDVGHEYLDTYDY
jgi:hypothetical protein